MNSRSILQCLAAWKRVSSDMLEIYGDFAVVQPVLAKSLTSGQALMVQHQCHAVLLVAS